MGNAIRIFRAIVGALLGLVLALPVFLLVSLFLFVSWLAQTIARKIEPPALPWPQLIEFDPILGWKAKPNLKALHMADDGVFEIRTDAQGLCGRVSLADSKIVVFGDSFAAGYGIDDKDSFANLDPQLGIKPVGINGYSMVQPLILMERYAGQLRKKLVVWFIYYGNDLYDNLSPDMHGRRAPFVREINGTGEWETVTHHISPTWWPLADAARLKGLHYHPRLAELCSPTFLSQRAYSACEFLIRKGRDVCEQAGAKLVVLTIPDTTQLTEQGIGFLMSHGSDLKSFDADYPDKMIGKICRRLGVPFVATKDHMDATHFNLGDCHWNPKGHRRIAELLAGIYRDHASERQSSPPCDAATLAASHRWTSQL
jgi:hypothetical protein